MFQPIVDMRNGALIGYEGLIRGPQGSPLHSPFHLFSVARRCGLGLQLESLCSEIILKKFVELALPGRIFLNISPDFLSKAGFAYREKLAQLEQIGLAPRRIILELTENQATYDYEQMRDVLKQCRDLGFQIAIDDLGEGFSSLRLWSEILPDYVKIDMHFIQGIDRDPVKLQFVQSIQQIATKSGAVSIAEGIETADELRLLQELGISWGQGYHIARPHAQPASAVAGELVGRIRHNTALTSAGNQRGFNLPTALKLLRIVPIATPDTSTNAVYTTFAANPELAVMPVVRNGVPLGIINRFQFIDRLARPYQRELYGKRSCTEFMTPSPLTAEKNTPLQDISLMIVEGESHHFSNGFAITDQGRYIGVGSSQEVMREITQMQINAARYANPLTQLPGNVPINEEIDRRLTAGAAFNVCYIDIDNFKPFNDVYGYLRGDDIIRLTGDILARYCVPGMDFLGHVGGDDFIILYQSGDWEERCNGILAAFASAIPAFFSAEDRRHGGYVSEDRRGNKVFHALVSLSLGVVKIDASRHLSSYQIAAAAAEAKKQAKTIAGNSLFIERRALK
ncbi:GGDEF domain-containing protein [Janthinobacterium sp. 17J80-10]|uniref:GGDEF domain-containing protein n=1 Tax=Janthinobacterium sp. 17J80-10 TaxID=2497863 RepID=UPI001F512C47|nr:GGDEF domain-containing protein [Janthinobacterium sp. 17J80-10]